MIEAIRNLIPYEEFDYQMLVSCLSDYARPRDKITALLRKGDIIRIKKGLYIFGENYRRRPYSREILANLMYGPSYISLEYALHYHGMIPERVESVTSVTTARARAFDTPAGRFTYVPVPLAGFQTGVQRIELEDGRSFLMAVPEKALADKLLKERGVRLQSQKEMQHFLFEDLRMDPEVVIRLDTTGLAEFAWLYGSRRILLLSRFANRLQNTETNHA